MYEERRQMRLQKIDSFLIIVALFLVGYYVRQNQGTDIQPEPVNPVVIPSPTPEPQPDPEPEQILFYDDYDKALNTSIKFDRKLIVIFTADWCPHCVTLKNNINDISFSDKFIVCVLDTENKNNKNLVSEFRPRGLPTSIVIDSNEKEIDRKAGFSKSSYQSWIDSI